MFITQLPAGSLWLICKLDGKKTNTIVLGANPNT